MKKKWGAIKNAMFYYKDNLDFKLDISECEDELDRKMRIKFFLVDAEEVDNYFADLVRGDCNDNWERE